MSTYSGKNDFYDSVVEIHCNDDTKKLEEFLSRTHIFIRGADGREHLVVCTNEKEACKYYPYLTAIAVYNINKEYNTIILSSQSFIDSEEEEFISWKINSAYKYWRKCKRNKKVFDVDEFLKSVWWSNQEEFKIIAERVKEFGNKATFDDIHDSLHEHFRRKWFEEMIRVGWETKQAFNWCFNEFLPKDEVIKKRLGEALYTKYFTE